MRFTNGFGMPIHESRRIKKKRNYYQGRSIFPRDSKNPFGVQKTFQVRENHSLALRWFLQECLHSEGFLPEVSGIVIVRQGAMVLNRKSGGPELGGWLKRGNTWLQALVFLLRPIASQCKAQCTSSTSIYICISLSWALYVKCAQHSCYDLVRFHQTQKQGRNTLFS